jgi:hypothetical protein
MVLIGYWPLNESSDATEAKDYSGNENHGTIHDGGDSTVPGATGILGQNAYSFDGSSDEVAISNATYYEVQSFTLSAWVKLSSKGEFGIISNYGGGDSNEHYGLRYGSIDGDGDYRANVYYDDGGSSGYGFTILYGDKDIGDGNWHHVLGVRKASIGRMELYVDGKLENFSTGQYSGTLTPSADFLIGNDASGSHFHLEGFVCEARLYNHSLTPAEVQYLYQAGKRGRQVTSSRSS